jgi:hypothetical protein
MSGVNLRASDNHGTRRSPADPVRLMRLFGITSRTAIHYVRAAHPECFTIDPTQA